MKRRARRCDLADESPLPDGELKDFSEKQRELRKTEFDVRDAIEALGHDVFSIGVSDDLSFVLLSSARKSAKAGPNDTKRYRLAVTDNLLHELMLVTPHLERCTGAHDAQWQLHEGFDAPVYELRKLETRESRHSLMRR